MKVYNDWSTKYKGDLAIAVNNNLDPQYYIDNNYDFNLNNSYVETRHRVTASVQAAAEFGRVKISLRESYQFTHRDSADFVKVMKTTPGLSRVLRTESLHPTAMFSVQK